MVKSEWPIGLSYKVVERAQIADIKKTSSSWLGFGFGLIGVMACLP